ncbi:MAG: succinate dehydrogenase, hydrophobic membrane anchor protein [Alphaproteobacteria bacterium]|nr:succinate dehydrogenase, hydrophobic membrane anchor protein [Alphaproteobacteria bacterium]MDE2340887.1 succinate dehydrogenase, hydrophobic membrane anchor protein [Alphaproteobacteria bacterium]
MGTGTELGRVRGLGSAKAGAHHWWLQRLTALGNLLLTLWLVISLLILPSFDYDVVHAWVASPINTVLLALLIINVCWHFRLGLQVVIEDYVHGASRLLVLGLLHIWTFGTGGFALYALLKIAFTGSAH